MTNKTLWISIAILCAGILSVVTAAANPALIVAGDELNLPSTGSINVVLSSKPGTPTERINLFNLFEYGTTLSNYDPERWEITLPEHIQDGEILHDAPENLLYLSYRYVSGTLFMLR